MNQYSTSNQYSWEWNSTTKQYDVITLAEKCHRGNTAIYKEKDGGTLFIGGWGNGAIITPNTHVIDLTGTEHKFRDVPMALDHDSMGFMPFIQTTCAGWLSLPFPDMGVPSNIKTLDQWKGITGQIKKILKSKKDVLVACLGGHGRSGMFCAIVGYLLNKKDKEWASPVEQIRKIHCSEAVETYSQEKYVYDILGLDVKVTHVYPQPKTSGVMITSNTKKQVCPICGIESVYVKDYNMCLTCHNQWQSLVEVKQDLTEDDITNVIPHTCLSGKNCLGIYKASVCGHVVHDMIIYDGLCENCAWEAEYAKKADEQESAMGPCVVCEKSTIYGKRYGVCYECAEDLKKRNAVDSVHNSITDAYASAAHKCENIICNGIVLADVCGHVTHDQEIQDGLCPDCRELRGIK